MSYLYETHFHTDESSGCGKIPAAEGVAIYAEAGYAGICVTDHFQAREFVKNKEESWKSKIDLLLTGYHRAAESAPDGFDVLLGAEIRFPKQHNDYLLFGADEAFFYDNPEMTEMSLKEFSSFAHRHNIIIIQAHPFRNDITVARPELVDGWEIYNGNRRQKSRNDIAEAWGRRFGKIMTSGSDFHQPEDKLMGGMAFEKRLRTSTDLRDALIEGNYMHRKEKGLLET